MLTSLLRNKLLLVVLIIIVLGGAWFGLSSSSAPAPALTSAGDDTSGDSAIVSTLLTLQAITLSGTIFTNPAFASLKDFTTAIIPVPSGRPDPFAPVSASVQSPPAAAAGKSAQIFQATE